MPPPDNLPFCCPCCLGTLHEHLFFVNGTPIRQCTTCGLGRAEMGSFDPSRYYSEAYFSGGHPDGYANYAETGPTLRAEFARTVKVLLESGVRGGRLLEIGCAYGFFLEEASRHFEVHGIEISEAAVAACSRRGLDTVLHGTVTRETMDEIGELDAIVMLDVIEHLSDPFEVLELAVEKLQPGGVVLMTTGDFGSPLARILGPRWRLMTPPQHLWFFIPQSIRALAFRLGLRILSITRPWRIVPMSLIWYQLNRMSGRHLDSMPGWMSRLGVPINLFDTMRVILAKG